jgi:hypothetical protein
MQNWKMVLVDPSHPVWRLLILVVGGIASTYATSVNYDFVLSDELGKDGFMTLLTAWVLFGGRRA